LLLKIASNVNYFSAADYLERTALIIGAWPTIEERESIFSPQLIKYSKSFTFD